VPVVQKSVGSVISSPARRPWSTANRALSAIAGSIAGAASLLLSLLAFAGVGYGNPLAGGLVLTSELLVGLALVWWSAQHDDSRFTLCSKLVGFAIGTPPVVFIILIGIGVVAYYA
jgi:hypothetical protein